MAKKVESNELANRLDNMTITDLLSYREGCILVHDYYDNITQANMGSYDDFAKIKYEENLSIANTYKVLGEEIFKAIKRKVDSI